MTIFRPLRTELTKESNRMNKTCSDLCYRKKVNHQTEKSRPIRTVQAVLLTIASCLQWMAEKYNSNDGAIGNNQKQNNKITSGCLVYLGEIVQSTLKLKKKVGGDKVIGKTCWMMKRNDEKGETSLSLITFQNRLWLHNATRNLSSR